MATSRNTLSHANKNRNGDMMEEVFWNVLSHLPSLSPQLGPAGRYCGLLRRFKRAFHAVDSTTIALLANCMDWARHRRRKAAAKMHLRLKLQSFPPAFAMIEEAYHHDDTRALALCAGLGAGEIAIFDKAYVHFAHLFYLSGRGISRVTRAKDHLSYHICRKRAHPSQPNIIRDVEITLVTPKSRAEYPRRLRRVEAWVEMNGGRVVMVFLTITSTGPPPAFVISIVAAEGLTPSSSKSNRLSKSATLWAIPNTPSPGNSGPPCCFTFCCALSPSKLIGPIASPGFSLLCAVLFGIGSEFWISPNPMGQHGVDGACARAFNWLFYRDYRREAGGQQQVIKTLLS